MIRNDEIKPGYQIPANTGMDPDLFDYAVNRLGWRPEDIVRNPSKAADAVKADMRSHGVAPYGGMAGDLPPRGQARPQYDLSKLSKEQKRQLAAEAEEKGSIKAAVKELKRQERQFIKGLSKEEARIVGAGAAEYGAISKIPKKDLTYLVPATATTAKQERAKFIGNSNKLAYEPAPGAKPVIKSWINIRTGEAITDAQYQVLNASNSIKADEYVRTRKGLKQYADNEAKKIEKLTGVSPQAAKTAAAASLITKVVPGPYDDAALYAVLGGAALVMSGAIAYNKLSKELPKVPEALSEAISDWKRKTGRDTITTSDVIVNTKSGAMTLTEAMDRAKSPISEQLIPPGQIKTQTGIRELTPPNVVNFNEKLSPPDIARIQEAIRATPGVKGLYLPTPNTTKQDIIKRAGGIIKAEAAYLEAENTIVNAVAVKTLPVDWNKTLNDARQANIRQAFRDINKQVARAQAAGEIDKTDASDYHRALSNLIAKRQILADTRRQYVASLNPTPIQGATLSPKASIALLAATIPYIRELQTTAFNIAQAEITKNKPIKTTIEQIHEYVRESLQPFNLTNTQTNALTKVITQQAIKTATQVATQTQTRTAVSEATAEATQAAEMADVAETAATATATATATTTAKPIPPPLPKRASNKKKRQHIRQYKGGITTYNMGQLNIKGTLKDVWWVDFDNGESLTVIGKAPRGARILADGPGSASKTAQRIGKKRVFPVIRRQHGAVTATVRPVPTQKGASINFHSVKRYRQHYTRMPGGVAISKKPLRNK